jgi:hypothetical protein
VQHWLAMALTVTVVESYIEALETALLRGERSVQFSDRAVTYQSIDDILKAIKYFKGLLVTLSGRSRQSVGVATKGL